MKLLVKTVTIEGPPPVSDDEGEEAVTRLDDIFEAHMDMLKGALAGTGYILKVE